MPTLHNLPAEDPAGAAAFPVSVSAHWRRELANARTRPAIMRICFRMILAIEKGELAAPFISAHEKHQASRALGDD